MVISDVELIKLVFKQNLIDAKVIEDLRDYMKNTGASLTDTLIEKNIATDEKLGSLIAKYLKIPFIILSKISIPENVFRIIPERIARKYKVIPFSKDEGSIKVAMADPKNQAVIDTIVQKTGLKIIPYLATERDIINTFYIYRQNLQKIFDDVLQDVAPSARKDVSIANIVDMIIEYASQDKASDIHIEPQDKDVVVRFRIDGMLHDILRLPVSLQDRIITRIKVLSRLRTDEHLAAQDGKMRFVTEDETFDIRVSILPIVDGEKAVLRLLPTHARRFSLADLGMNPSDLNKLTRALKRSYGMILSSGPTGSGKSTTIYAILRLLNKREKNITTVEDPVEYRIKGVNQINVNPKAGLTFATGLRSILRQDPNIIFVGEIRDFETAGIAVNAALTGHLVVSTLHTNDAATALPRLIDMKVEPFLVASTINVIIAQRLVRQICENCKTSIEVPRSQLIKNFSDELIKKHFGNQELLTIYHGDGCSICRLTGFAGRIGVFEILEITKEIKKLIALKADADEILKQALKEGMTTMLDDGLDKVKNGLTTLEEVLRVTKVEAL